MKMKNFYSKYLSDELWRIKESEFKKNLQNVRESQFSLGNGLIGSRGVLEEKPKDSQPGTYLAGLYDSLTAQVAELVNLPNPFYFKFIAFGQKVGITAMDVVSHERILNTESGTLSRHTIYSDNKKRRYDYQSIRFLSMDNKNIGVMQIILTPLDSDLELEFQTGIDTYVYNLGVATEGRKRHFAVSELSKEENSETLVIKTFDKHLNVIYHSGFYYKVGAKKRVHVQDNVSRVKLKKNQRAVFTKIFYISSFLEKENLAKYKIKSKKVFSKALKSNFKTLINKHMQAWKALWEISDILIEGTADIQKNVRFNIYHLLICAHSDQGLSSIGARTLSGEGYRGHVFWDAEIFLLPFYAYQFPEVAKNMLLYRYKRIEPAKAIAKAKGYAGVLFPWESAGVGREETPSWAKNLDGTIIKIKTAEFEQHIVSDITYACYNYFQITADKNFMEDYGYEIIFESARFWASRVAKGKRGKVNILNIMGPDEFHEKVNNNAYTNLMAKWNLTTAQSLYRQLKKSKKTYNRLKTKLKLTDKEVKRWLDIASGITIKIKRNRVIEQFDNFSKKKYIEIVNFDENNIPLLPEGVRVSDYNKTQFVKQADVIMALYLLGDSFDYKTKESNFWFYLRRTLHKSSLSAAVHAIMAAEIGALSRAYQFFNVALRADISDLHGNTHEGVHAASLGGVWQCIIGGFAGVKIQKGILSVSPYMPLTWQSIKFNLFFRGLRWEFQARKKEVKVKVFAKTKGKLKITVFGKIHNIETNKSYNFKAKKQIKKISLAEKYY
jgi:kojibiose phosphorylase